MQKITAIIENTFKEGMRQRVLILIGVFSAVLIVVSVFLEPFALGEAPKILRDVGLAVPAFFGVLVVIIVGSTLIHKDIEKRTMYTVITKPVRRSEIIVGKFLGLFLLIVILEFGMAFIQQLTLFVYEGNVDLSLLAALPFLLLETAVLLGILLLFSSFSTPTLSAIMGVFFFLIGHASPDLKMFADQVRLPFLKYLAYAFYYVLPNLENFNFRLELVYELPLYADQVFFSIAYGLIYTIFLVYVAVIVFERREFK